MTWLSECMYPSTEPRKEHVVSGRDSVLYVTQRICGLEWNIHEWHDINKCILHNKTDYLVLCSFIAHNNHLISGQSPLGLPLLLTDNFICYAEKQRERERLSLFLCPSMMHWLWCNLLYCCLKKQKGKDSVFCCHRPEASVCGKENWREKQAD